MQALFFTAASVCAGGGGCPACTMGAVAVVAALTAALAVSVDGLGCVGDSGTAYAFLIGQARQRQWQCLLHEVLG